MGTVLIEVAGVRVLGRHHLRLTNGRSSMPLSITGVRVRVHGRQYDTPATG
jgi:hypothetical protein